MVLLGTMPIPAWGRAGSSQQVLRASRQLPVLDCWHEEARMPTAPMSIVLMSIVLVPPVWLEAPNLMMTMSPVDLAWARLLREQQQPPESPGPLG